MNLSEQKAIIDYLMKLTSRDRLSPEGLSVVSGFLKGIVKDMKGERIPESTASNSMFCPELIQSDTDMIHLAHQLETGGTRQFSICITGPSGTGKKAFIRYLAAKLGLPVLVKNTSDLLSMHAGQSRQQIAGAFMEALENTSFLILDDADFLLFDRRMDIQSREGTQVNDMITCMENHPLPFACTTSLGDRLDPAWSERFTFTCRLDYLSQVQVRLAFQEFFQLELLDDKDMDIGHLTSGDFMVVLEKASVFGIRSDMDQVIRLLRQEVNARRDGA